MTNKKDLDLGTDWLRGLPVTILKWYDGGDDHPSFWGWGNDKVGYDSEPQIMIDIVDGGYRVSLVSYSSEWDGKPIDPKVHESFELAVADVKARIPIWLGWA